MGTDTVSVSPFLCISKTLHQIGAVTVSYNACTYIFTAYAAWQSAVNVYIALSMSIRRLLLLFHAGKMVTVFKVSIFMLCIV